VEYFDMPVVRKIVRDASHNGDRFAALVMGVVGSPEFQMQQPRSSADQSAQKTANKGPARQPPPAT
jgi:hypothetical protein